MQSTRPELPRRLATRPPEWQRRQARDGRQKAKGRRQKRCGGGSSVCLVHYAFFFAFCLLPFALECLRQRTLMISSIDETRRRFIAQFSSLGLGGTLLPGILWAEMQQTGTLGVQPITA